MHFEETPRTSRACFVKAFSPFERCMYHFQLSNGYLSSYGAPIEPTVHPRNNVPAHPVPFAPNDHPETENVRLARQAQ